MLALDARASKSYDKIVCHALYSSTKLYVPCPALREKSIQCCVKCFVGFRLSCRPVFCNLCLRSGRMLYALHIMMVRSQYSFSS